MFVSLRHQQTLCVATTLFERSRPLCIYTQPHLRVASFNPEHDEKRAGVQNAHLLAAAPGLQQVSLSDDDFVLSLPRK